MDNRTVRLYTKASVRVLLILLGSTLVVSFFAFLLWFSPLLLIGFLVFGFFCYLVSIVAETIKIEEELEKWK